MKVWNLYKDTQNRPMIQNRDQMDASNIKICDEVILKINEGKMGFSINDARKNDYSYVLSLTLTSHCTKRPTSSGLQI